MKTVFSVLYQKKKVELCKVMVGIVMYRDNCTYYQHSGLAESDSTGDEGPMVALIRALWVSQSCTKGDVQLLYGLVQRARAVVHCGCELRLF